MKTRKKVFQIFLGDFSATHHDDEMNKKAALGKQTKNLRFFSSSPFSAFPATCNVKKVI